MFDLQVRKTKYYKKESKNIDLYLFFIHLSMPFLFDDFS
jgi:hypothetical protein